MSHHRRTIRHPCQLELRLLDGSRPRPALTGDVSEHGLYVRIDERWVPNALVRLHVFDPDDPRPLALLGIVARCIPPEAVARSREDAPGIGVSLFGNGAKVEARWKALVRRAAAAAAGWRPALESEGAVIDAVRRSATRRQALLEVELEAGVTREPVDLADVSEEGVFLRTDQLLANESAVKLHFRAVDGEQLSVPAVTMRSVDSLDPEEKGVGLRMVSLGSAREPWEAFLQRHAPVRHTLPAFLPTFDWEEPA